jgi:serine/threonine-protein phosphatase 4 regulatory subunit 1
VCLTLGPDRWDELRELYLRLQRRAGDKVLRTLAASLHEIAKILYPEQVEHDLLPVYERCLNSSDEIRERVYEHVDVLYSRVPPATGWRLILDMARAWKEGKLGGWRARELLAFNIPSFAETFGKSQNLDPVLDLTHDALLDPFAAVRNAATSGVSRARLEECLHAGPPNVYGS